MEVYLKELDIRNIEGERSSKSLLLKMYIPSSPCIPRFRGECSRLGNRVDDVKICFQVKDVVAGIFRQITMGF